ncbi:MAG: hypothetical protein PHE79_04015 [Eubacteriales bacterium]|nr:hypothetical protein [Eubacteriales bacterium]
MNYIKYNRSFVMMEEQNNQFASKESAEVKGYLKVETGNNKGAIRCAVQNLKYYEKGDYIYKLILFGKKGEKTIHTVIGNLLINRYGNGESYFRFSPVDIDGKGNTYHNFTTAIIAAASTVDEKESLHPVLKGVTSSGAEPFQSELFRIDEEIENEDNGKVGDIINKIDQIVEELEETVQREKIPGEITVDETDSDKKETHSNEANADTKDVSFDEAGAVAKDISIPKEKEISKKVYNNFYNEYILRSCYHACQIAEFYEDVAPFDKDRTGARWKKMVNITNLPLVSPGAHYFATQYRHYIFGAKANDKGIAVRYFFGVPGRFLDEEQPDGGKSGFTYWQPIRGEDSAVGESRKASQSVRNAYGYWIVAIDAETGNIEEV